MERFKQHQKRITKYLFLIYLTLLIWIVILKLGFSFKDLYGSREINLIPFLESVMINNKISLKEIYANIIIFLPFGLYISMLKPKHSFLQKVIPMAALSLIFESIQYIFAIGAVDITDVIGNTLGGIIGVLLYKVISKLFKDKGTTNSMINILTLIGMVSFIGLAGLLIIVNM